jgi:hypothetical protein
MSARSVRPESQVMPTRAEMDAAAMQRFAPGALVVVRGPYMAWSGALGADAWTGRTMRVVRASKLAPADHYLVSPGLPDGAWEVVIHAARLSPAGGGK